MTQIKLKLDGLTCDMCVRSVTNILKLNSSVKEVTVGLKEANVEVTDPSVGPELVQSVEEIGYQAKLA